MERGWIIHTVIDDETGQGSGHTHGLDKLGILEVEINLNLRPGVLGQYLNLIADSIAHRGLVLEDGLRVTEIFNCPLYFFKTKSIQSEDEIYRAIFPDEFGMYPWDRFDGRVCADGYREQIELKVGKVFYVDTELNCSEDEVREILWNIDKGRISIDFKLERIEGSRLISKPYKYLSTDGGVFYTKGLCFEKEEKSLSALGQYIESKVRVLCKNATPEQIEEYQNVLYFKDAEL